MTAEPWTFDWVSFWLGLVCAWVLWTIAIWKPKRKPPREGK